MHIILRPEHNQSNLFEINRIDNPIIRTFVLEAYICVIHNPSVKDINLRYETLFSYLSHNQRRFIPSIKYGRVKGQIEMLDFYLKD